MGRLVVVAVGMVLGLGVGACGGDDGAGGPRTLNLYTFTAGTGGAFERAAERCNDRAGGRYRIAISDLPPNADDQREQLARRLAAQDDSIDLMALDVIFTGEFAEAGWVVPFPAEVARPIERASIPSTYATGVYEGRLYAAPYTSNTQLLWYRKDRVPRPPRTWGEVLAEGRRLGDAGGVVVQGAKAEGYVVWFASLLSSAGGRILRSPTRVDLAPGPTRRALEAMRALATSDQADRSLPNQAEDQGRLAFQTGRPSFMVNYPFIYPSAKADAPEVFRQIGAARYPGVAPDRPSSPPLGGTNLAVGAFSKAKREAFDAVACLRRPENQLAATELGGLPPTQADLFDDPVVARAYPGFADLMRESIAGATPRPATPAYADVSLAIQEVLHPPAGIDPAADVARLRETVQRALDSEGLL